MLRIEEAERGSAITEDHFLVVRSKSPTFAIIREGVEEVEGGAVIDQRDVVLPGELNEGVAPGREAFGEVL